MKYPGIILWMISEKITPNVIKGKGFIEQYPEWDEEEDDYE